MDTLIDSLREGFVLCRMVRDRHGRVIDYVIADANQAFLRGLGAPSAVGQRILQIRPDTSPAWFDTCSAILDGGKPKRVEYWDPVLQRWFDAAITPVASDELIMLYVDVTRRKREETQAQERAQELNHRVKNNLNLVAAMLTLQARGASAETKLALDQAVARVYTISQVHDLLHRAGSVETVNLDHYLQDLCRKVQRSLAPEGITVALQADAIQVSVEQAVELGVIINELLTNAIKYAYPAGKTGEVRVTSHIVDGRLELTIGDDGGGAPGNHAAGLGMKLVHSIVRQIGGECAIQTSEGTHIRVRLPLQNAESDQQRLF